MAGLREKEDICFKETTDLAVAFLEKFAKGEMTENVEVPDSLLAVRQMGSKLPI